VIKDKIRQKGIQSRTLAHLLAGIDEAMQEL
jgi:hypothetical protein